MRKAFGAVIVAISVLAFVFVLLLRQDPTVYATDRVKVAAVGLNDDGLRLHFRPPNEVGYHCPGVLFRREGSSIHYEYVRSRVDENVTVDSQVVTDQQGDLCVTFPYLGGKWEKGDHVELIDSKREPDAKFKLSR